MSWRGLLALAWVAAGLPAGGCAADPPRSGEWTAVALPGRPQDAAGAVAVASSGVARSQKPESNAVARGILQPPERPGNTQPAAQILATVNGEPILREEILAACFAELANARSATERSEILKKTLDNTIDRDVIVQEINARFSHMGPQGTKILGKLKEDATKDFERNYVRYMVKAHKLSGEDELRRRMGEQGQSLDLIQRQYERNWLAKGYLHSRITPWLDFLVGHKEIAEYYDKHPEEFQFTDTVDWQDLFVDAQTHRSPDAARKFAESLATRLRHGEDFLALAKQYNTGDSTYRNHEGAGHHRGEIRPPQAEPVLFRMKEGEIAVIEIGSGCHVVRLVHRVFAGPMPFDEKVQKQIRDKLRGEAAQREMDRIKTELKRKAVIEIAPGWSE